MTEDELEDERVALIEAVNRGPITDDLRERIAHLAEAQSDDILDPVDEALREVIAEAVALTDRTLPVGLDTRVVGDLIHVFSRGVLLTSVSRSGLIERARQIEARRAASN